MRKNKNVVSAKFCREPFVSTPSIEVTIRGASESISLFDGIIDHCARVLSEKELEGVIAILSEYKAVMLEERNFPPIYEEMLSDLIKVQKARYGTEGKKEGGRALGYSVRVDKLEEILGDYYKIRDVHIYSIDVGGTRSKSERIDLSGEYRYFVMSFREENRDDR